MRVVGTIEARMGSSRLPGKTLMEIAPGLTLLGLVVARFRLCSELSSVWVATSLERGDDPVARWCEEHQVPFHRGSEDDVLERVTETAVKAGADAIVQMGADSAYLDYQLIDQLVGIYRSGAYDYVCNDLKLTYPLGIYGHVVRVSLLQELNARRDLSVHDREDVVRPIFEHPGDFAVASIEAPEALRHPELRLTIDYPEDLEQARAVYAHFGNHPFTAADLVALSGQRPELFEKTGNLVQRSAPFLASA